MNSEKESKINRLRAEVLLRAEIQDRLMDDLLEMPLKESVGLCVDEVHQEYPGAFNKEDIETITERVQESINDFLNGRLNVFGDHPALDPFNHIFGLNKLS